MLLHERNEIHPPHRAIVDEAVLAAMRHPGFRAQFITFVPAMMADNRPRDLNPSSRGDRRRVVFWLPTAILLHPGRLLLITRRTA
jgi:hypothetical protein